MEHKIVLINFVIIVSKNVITQKYNKYKNILLLKIVIRKMYNDKMIRKISFWKNLNMNLLKCPGKQSMNF